MIIALKDKDRIYLACSVAEMMFNSCRDDYIDVDNLTMWKVKKIPNCYMACVTMCLETDIIRYTHGLLPNEINYKTINSVFIPNVKELLKGIDLASTSKWKNDLIIVKDDNIYLIDRYFCSLKIQDFCAFGYGEDVVTGVLSATQGFNPIQRIFDSFNNLDNMKKCKSFPFIIIDTKTNKKIIANTYNDIEKYTKILQK